MDKASPTEAAEDTGSGEFAGKLQNHHQQWCVISQLIYIYIYIYLFSQMEYEHNFLENFIQFYHTTLYFYCLKCTVQTLSLLFFFITCNLFFLQSCLNKY